MIVFLCQFIITVLESSISCIKNLVLYNVTRRFNILKTIGKRILLILQIMFKNKLKNKDDIFEITKKEMIICNKISS